VQHGFLEIEQFGFKAEVINKAYEFLAHAGKERFEAVALFAGTVSGATALVTEAILPLQKSYKLESGLMYHVEGEELHRINVWLYKNKLKLLGQIHSHPTEAYHSETDDEYPIISTVGGLSIVVPNFARGKMKHDEWAYYRLSQEGQWVEVNFESLIKII
jgi:hypothetical protein